MRLHSINFILLVICQFNCGATVPLIESTPQVETDGLSILKPSEVSIVRTGFKFRVLSAHTSFVEIDESYSSKPTTLVGALSVNQLSFLNDLNAHCMSPAREVVVEKVECFYSEMNDTKYSIPTFRIKWILFIQATKEHITLEAFSFGLKYNGWIFSSEKRKALKIKGAAAAYQAATYKLAMQLNEKLKQANDPIGQP